MNEFKNFFNLIEFLVGAFLRFMKWSNIMDLSYASSCSSPFHPGNKLLNHNICTFDASSTRTFQPKGTACSRLDHSFLKIRFGAWEEEDAGWWWKMSESRHLVLECSGYGWSRGNPHFWSFECWSSFCFSFFWDLTLRWYLWGDCSFSRKDED